MDNVTSWDVTNQTQYLEPVTAMDYVVYYLHVIGLPVIILVGLFGKYRHSAPTKKGTVCVNNVSLFAPETQPKAKIRTTNICSLTGGILSLVYAADKLHLLLISTQCA